MKKAKLIIPAVALLAISGAASVTGTVAWFTSANTAVFGTSAITAVSVDSTLSVQHVAGFINCADDSGTITQTNNITDSSFDATTATKDFYKATFNDVSGATTSAASYYKAVSGVANAEAYVVSWISEFSAPGGESYDLFFDFTSSTMNPSSSTAAALAPAYRLYAAEVTLTEGTGGAKSFNAYGTESFVWGAKATTLDHVAKAGDAKAEGATVAYNASSNPTGVVGNTTTQASASATQATARANAGYLGNIPASGKLAVQFVIYCEGTDTACITTNQGQSITSSFHFYSRNIAGYTTGA